jgi:hypothetical protein
VGYFDVILLVEAIVESELLVSLGVKAVVEIDLVTGLLVEEGVIIETGFLAGDAKLLKGAGV